MSDNSLRVRFGDEILQEGFTSIPNLVLDYYNELDISSLEMIFIIHIWQYWWSKKEPYPSLFTIAERMGISRRQASRYVESLKEKKLLEVHERYDEQLQTTNEYDFSSMIDKIVALFNSHKSEPDGAMTDMSKQAMTKTSKRKNQSKIPKKPAMTNMSSLTKMSNEEYEVIEYTLEMILGEIRSNINRGLFRLLFEDVEVVTMSNDSIVLSSPNKAAVELFGNYRDTLSSILSGSLGRTITLDLVQY